MFSVCCSSDRKSMHAPDKKTCHWKRTSNSSTTSIEGVHVDVQRMGSVFKADDFKAIVELISSQEPIEPYERKLHPWAEDPKTVGARCICQLAIRASFCKHHETIKDCILEAGAIPALVSSMESFDVDRVQHAVVALSFLTAEHAACAGAARQAGAMLSLLNLSYSPPSLGAAACSTLRNLFVTCAEQKYRFVELGGLEALVDQLTASFDNMQDDARRNDCLLESALNLQDCVETDDGTVIREIAHAAVHAGAAWELERLLQVPDQEVIKTAQAMLANLRYAFPDLVSVAPSRPLVALTIQPPLEPPLPDTPCTIDFVNIAGDQVASFTVELHNVFNTTHWGALATIAGVPVWRLRVLLPSGALLSRDKVGTPMAQLLFSSTHLQSPTLYNG